MSKKYKIEIAGCGCCSSPFLLELKDINGEYVENDLCDVNWIAKEPEWHSRLWEGCPIWSTPDDDGISINYWHRAYSKWFRLPTIEESPRNTWLLHDGSNKCPEGAEDLDILVWWGERLSPNLMSRGGDLREWGVVDKFMIIDKRAFK